VNTRLDIRIVGLLIAGFGGLEIVHAAIAWWLGEPPLPFLWAGALCALAGGAIAWLARPDDARIRPRDAYLIVAGGWLAGSAASALPFVTSGVLGPVDAFFEAVSGITTTGSTVMTRIEAAPSTLLLWRALIQWLGGMGIVLFAVAVLPLLGIGGMQLFRVEVPGPVKDKLRPRVIGTARRLWVVYVGLTALQAGALWLAGLSPFDAICHAFTTLATGGFSTRDASIAAFASPGVEWILIVFMALAGINFVIHYRLLSEGPRVFRRDEELRSYLATIALAALLFVVLMPGEHASTAGDAIRNALFTAVTLTTTTGYGTVDFERWSGLAQVVVLQLMILGGMAGSTAGGVKSLRVLIGFRALGAAIAKLTHPHAVKPVKHAGQAIPDDVVAGVWAFFTAYFAIAMFAAGVVAACGYDLVTAASAALTSLSNVGPGLGALGPTDNFAHLPDVAKLVLAACMLAGRLELFTFLVVLTPGFWRR
jgi:trk system potassium uptake protein TrkH